MKRLDETKRLSTIKKLSKYGFLKSKNVLKLINSLVFSENVTIPCVVAGLNAIKFSWNIWTEYFLEINFIAFNMLNFSR